MPVRRRNPQAGRAKRVRRNPQRTRPGSSRTLPAARHIARRGKKKANPQARRRS